MISHAEPLRGGKKPSSTTQTKEGPNPKKEGKNNHHFTLDLPYFIFMFHVFPCFHQFIYSSTLFFISCEHLNISISCENFKYSNVLDHLGVQDIHEKMTKKSWKITKKQSTKKKKNKKSHAKPKKKQNHENQKKTSWKGKHTHATLHSEEAMRQPKF